jgi:molecular chaperone DnaJ
MRRDYYAVLGIAATAGPRELRQAYRRLARQYSPDVNFWDARAHALFEEIAEAYRVLSDPGARRLYDRFGSGGAVELGPGRRGEDVHVSVQLEFADVARGITLEVDALRFSPCDVCGARGLTEDAPCEVCLARGVRRRVDPVPVVIPPGVDTGVEIRVAGEGNAGPYGGPRGDLVVSTHVREHPFFTRRGDNIHCEVPVSVWEALRGARVQVPTPTGEAVIIVPPGTSAGQVFRLRGQGLPKLAGDGVGDLYVTVQVDVPGGLDARTHELIRELERLLPVAPRAHLNRYNGGAA